MTSFSPELLWTKARVFINRAMDPGDLRSFDEQALWASLSLELLAKAALSRVSPLLIAEPTTDGANLLAASGLIPGEAVFTSVRAKTLYARCARAFQPFSGEIANKITFARNEYLHGGLVGFGAVPARVWWPQFWAQANVLVTALDKDLDDFVGASRVPIVEAYLLQNVRYIEERTESLIERARQRFEQLEAGTLPERIAAEWRRRPNPSAGLSYTAPRDCPACGFKDALVEGDFISHTETEYEQLDVDDFDVTITHEVVAERFSCPRCHLVLEGTEFVQQANIDTEVFVEGDLSDYDYEPDYGND